MWRVWLISIATATAMKVFVFCRDAKILLSDENKQNLKKIMVP